MLRDYLQEIQTVNGKIYILENTEAQRVKVGCTMNNPRYWTSESDNPEQGTVEKQFPVGAIMVP